MGVLIRAGYPVPPGFVITTAAYAQVVDANALQNDIDDVIRGGGAAALRSGFESAVLPPALERAIVDAYLALGGGSVAVRSSATAEDLPDAAFAGQQETFLGITDAAGLLKAVRRCWASLWSDRAIAYRADHGLAETPVKLAVIVQRMIAADAAGVLFTANPVTGARDEAVINASTGLGEAVVSGLVTPDHIVLRHAHHRWRIVERHLGRRELEVRPRPGGTEHVTGRAAAGPALPDAVLLQLARIGASIARTFGRPQDIEWAWANATLFIVQSRPITALPDPPARQGRLSPPRFAADYLQVRPYPLDTTTWMAAMTKALPRMFPVEGLIPPLDSLLVEEDGVVKRFAGWPDFRLSPHLLLGPIRRAALARRHDPAAWRSDATFADYQQRVRTLELIDLQAKSWSELLAVARTAMALPGVLIEVRRRYFPRGALALAALRIVLEPLGLADRFATLLSGVDNLTLQANRALEAIAADIRTSPVLSEAFQSSDAAGIWAALDTTAPRAAFVDRLHGFLATYGHRETASPLLVSQPTWKDAPDIVVGMLQGLARVEPYPRPAQPSWQAARNEVLAHPLLRLPGARGAFLAVLTEARRVSAFREDTHYAMTMPMPILRRTLVELGRRLAAVGIIAKPEDIFHLRFEELEQVNGAWPPSPALPAGLKASTLRRADRRKALVGTPLMELPASPPGSAAGNALVTGAPGVRALPRDQSALSTTARTLVPCSLVKFWSPRTPIRRGRHSLPGPRPSSSIPAPRCRTRPS